VFSHETEIDAVFHCTVCGKELGFNKEGIPGNGTPSARFVDGAWVHPTHPDDPEIWIGECNAQS
jgi:hypothetical protein